MAQEKHCLCCGEQVPVNTVTRDGNVELTCVYCGFVLDVARPGSRKALECILTADDSGVTRDIVQGMLVNKKLANTVISFEDGQAVVAAFTKRLAEHQPVDVVILDVQMPVMDGITAARLIRSVEADHQKAKTPILFFSAQKCDEDLKRQIERFAPASYVNKGSDPDPEQLADRIDQLVAHLQTRS
jgi:CheY-like chemotaxis protein